MKKSQIYKIANVISEDPDVFYEENESHISLIYTNIFDETKEVTIKRAWAGRGPILGGQQQAPHYYLVEWASKSTTGKRIGVLTPEGLERESLARIQEIAQPNTQYWIFRRGIRRDQKKKQKWRKQIRTWDYMREQYGRCCPNWFEESHIDDGNNCRRAKYPDVTSAAGARPARTQPSDVSDQGPTPEEPAGAWLDLEILDKQYRTDYGVLSVLPRNLEPGQKTWEVALQGEEAKLMGYDEIVKYLRDEGINP